MNKFFTKSSLLTLVAFLAYGIGNAQVVLNVTAPASAAGVYDLNRATFGNTTAIDFEGELALGSPILACEPLTSDLTGKFAMLDRGNCPFVDKAKNAVDAGAVAVIICNNVAGAPPSPGGTDPHGITVPVFGMSLADCNRVKVALNAGETVVGRVQTRPCVSQVPANAIWGAVSGEGDFAGGLNGWITDNENGWTWEPDARINRGAFSGGVNVMLSPTGTCGAMVFDSDFKDNGGDPANQGGGVCPAPCTGNLVSPNIDLSGQQIEGLFVQFYQATRQFGSQYRLHVSTDNGETYPYVYNLNTELPTNSNHIAGNIRVGLGGIPLDEITQIRLRFEYVGNYYYWGIDDVFLINEAVADPQVNNNFYAVSPNYYTPVTQRDQFYFLSDIRNNGNVPAFNTVLTAEILDEANNNAVIYTDNLNYGAVDGGEQIENIPFENPYTHPDKVGSYLIRYSIDAEDNADNGNDEQIARFRMTDNVFSRVANEAEIGSAYLSNIESGLRWDVIGVGNYFTAGSVFNVPNGEGFKATKVRFGLGAPSGQQPFTGTATVQLFKYLGDVNANGTIDPIERQLIGEASDIIFPETPSLRNLEYELFVAEGVNGDEVALEDNTQYLVTINLAPNVSTAPVAGLLCVNPDQINQQIRSFYTQATNLAYSEKGIQRISTVIGGGANGADLDTRVLREFLNKALYIELEIDAINSTSDANNNIAVSVFPNPTTEMLFVDMKLAQKSSNVALDVMTMDGKLVQSFKYADVQTDVLKVNTNNLPTGMYVLNITTDNGVTSKKFAVKGK